MDDQVVIVSAARTAVGKFGGSLTEVNAGNLAATVIEEALKRAELLPQLVDEVILGEVRQTTESSNVARVAALRAGIPEEATAFTVNRLCASSMQAITSAVQQLQSKQAEVVVAGGTENMSRAPFYLRNSRFEKGTPQLVDSNTENGQQPQEVYGSQLSMGLTAEHVAERYHIRRDEQDAFAYQSQMKAAAALEADVFSEEIVPVQVKARKEATTFNQDEFPRPTTTLDSLSDLRPVFKERGTVTAGNACGRNDGAAAMILMTSRKAKELGVKPLGTIVDWATAGVSPSLMGIGPVPAIQKLLKRSELSLKEIDVIELNEAFAAQALAVIREADLDPQKVNVNGGAIALGHPLGATGCKITTTLLYEMMRSQKRYGLATLCVGGGQGMALLLKREG
ncbi:thiolase family protein [Salsuginibacillus kocurii]|uniref:thiolase family protein n=1 Tax=Salsuginibacillus kocurii TaxID=427078 RepID=UPI000380C366|nr:thiolase family protein [Salsuginibacillus kocurii]